MIILLFTVLIPLTGCGQAEFALKQAITKGDAAAAKAALDQGADVNTRDPEGRTALMLAADQGRSEIVKLLLDKRADVDAKDKEDHTALMLAAQQASTETVKLLLDGGATVDVKDKDGSTALMLAALNGNTDMVKLMLDKGADVNAKNHDGNTALMWAAEKGHSETVKTLLAGGADVNAINKDSWTALMWAAYAAQTETVKDLLAKGAVVNAIDKEGRTALKLADTGFGRRAQRDEIIRLLRKAGTKRAPSPGSPGKGPEGRPVVRDGPIQQGPQDLRLAAYGGDDLGEHLDGAAVVVELATAVIGDIDHLDSMLDGDLGILGRRHPFEDKGQATDLLDRIHRFPG